MKPKTTILALLLVLTATLPTRGNTGGIRDGLFWGFGLGGAYLDRTFSTTNTADDAQGRLYMEFYGGTTINPHVALGIEIGGWTISPDSDTYIWNPYWPPDNERSENPEGEGLMQIIIFSRIYPYKERNLFIKLGGGYLDHWLKTDYQTLREHGFTSVAGVGWDIALGGNWSLTPTLSYSYGKAGQQTHQAITASLGIMWHEWKVKNLVDLEQMQANKSEHYFSTWR